MAAPLEDALFFAGEAYRIHAFGGAVGAAMESALMSVRRRRAALGEER